jgi:hypothetical protein
LASQRLVLLSFDFQDAHIHQLGGFDRQVSTRGIEPGGVRLPGFIAAKDYDAGFRRLSGCRNRKGLAHKGLQK